MKRAVLDALVAARAAGRPMALATRLGDGAQWLVESGAAGGAPPEIAAAARAALAADESRNLEIGGEDVFVHVHTPPWRMMVVGAVHIAQALAPMAAAAGYRVLVVDPRGAFASVSPASSCRATGPTKRSKTPASTRIAPWPRSPTTRRSTTRR